MIEALIIQVMFLGTPIQHVQFIQDYEHYNRSVCLEFARRIRKTWKLIEGAEIIYIGCPDHWSET